jgi:cell shape-determining protein MreD
MDAAYGTWGIHMFVKTLVGFFVGRFAIEDRKPLLIQPQQALLGALAIAILHNGLLVILLALQTNATNQFLIYGLWLGSAAYTAAVAYIASLFTQ